MKPQRPYIRNIRATGSPVVPERRVPLGISKLKDEPSREPGEGVAAPPKRRAAFYVDGFNLYHALVELGDSSQNRHLRWLNLWALNGVKLMPKWRIAKLRPDQQEVFRFYGYPGTQWWLPRE